jgi:predicted nucleic acid-binding protein
LGLLSQIGSGPVGLDSAIFIYFIERDPRYLSIVKPVFVEITAGRLAAATSSITLLETLVMPLRAGNVVVARHYERLLTQGKGLQLIPIDLDLLRAAAHLRATARLKTPDSLQIAAALSCGCSVFIANDHRIPSVPGLRVLQIEDFQEASDAQYGREQ